MSKDKDSLNQELQILKAKNELLLQEQKELKE